jgi:prephenate dehydratase
VPQVYELLLDHDLTAVGETIINIDYVLAARQGTLRGDVRRVLSHPIALAQCGDLFRQNRTMEAVSVFDTAGAVKLILKEGDKHTAAIASRRAATLYGADILAEHIQDHRDNWTRFLLLAGRAHNTTVDMPDKALVAFALRHEPGALVAALQPIAAHGLSITKIEGLPRNTTAAARAHGQPFDYRFIVEMTASEGTGVPDLVYDDIRAVTTWLKLLGAYRV